eukprot:m.368681 g.368681  ORF g.368681 m.368681 type:complete len:381 (+) comp16666_c1_seq62:2095-3237(+)
MARPGQWASFECEPTANKQFKREASAADQGVATGQFLVAKRQPQEFQSLGVHDFGFSDFQPSGREPDFLCVAPQRVMRNEIDSVEHGSGTKVTFVWPDATPPVKHKMGSSQVTVYPAFYIEHKDHDFFLHLPNLRSLASGVNVGFVDDAGHLQSVLVLGAFFSNDQRLVAAATDLTRAKHGHIRNHVFLFVADARTGRPVKYPIVAALIQPLSDNDEKQMTDDGERVYTNFYRQSSLPRSAFGKMIPDNDTNDPLSTSRLQVRRGTRNRKPPQKLEVDHSAVRRRANTTKKRGAKSHKRPTARKQKNDVKLEKSAQTAEESSALLDEVVGFLRRRPSRRARTRRSDVLSVLSDVASNQTTTGREKLALAGLALVVDALEQ